MTKTELYKSIIDITKKTGQGLSGTVKVLGNDSYVISKYMDELIKEGHVVACDTGGSLGHPESNIFYMPSKGYNVWTDDGQSSDNYTSRHKGRYLHYIRLYLGCLSENEHPDENTKWLNPTASMYLRHPEHMKKYAEWLERNQEALETMLNLDYIQFDENLNDNSIKYLKELDCYNNNKKCEDCLHYITKQLDLTRQTLRARKDLIYLYKKEANKYSNELKKATSEYEEEKEELTILEDLHLYLRSSSREDMKTNIQELIKI